MKSITVICALCMLVSMNVAAEIYKCTDAAGTVGYGDKPCKGESTIFTPKARPVPDEDVRERKAKMQRLLNAYQEENAMDKQEAAALKADKEQRTQNCKRARMRYRQVLDAGRIFRYDKKGGRLDYTDQERTDATALLKGDIEKWCD